MRMCFVTRGSLSEFRGDPADIAIFPFQALGEVSFEKELSGETNLFEDVALLSKAGGCVVVCGCYTNARGVRRKSVVVAERGRILGVSDMVNRIDGSEFRCGAGIKTYETSLGKLGVVVAEDLYFPKVTETLSNSGAEVILSVFETLNESLEMTLIRADAFFYGVPICMCAPGYAQAADPAGRLRFSSPKSPCYYTFEREQEYHIIEVRRRGLLLRRKNTF